MIKFSGIDVNDVDSLGERMNKIMIDEGKDVAEKYEMLGFVERRCDADKARKYFRSAIEEYVKIGLNGKIGRIYEILANMEENLEEQINHFNLANEYYMKQSPDIIARSRCLFELALIYENKNNYKKSIELFLNAAEIKIANKFNPNKEIFYAILTSTIYDTVLTRKLIDKYKLEEIDEINFINSIIEAIETEDSSKFIKIYNYYDNIIPFDTWEFNMFVKITQSITNEPNLS